MPSEESFPSASLASPRLKNLVMVTRSSDIADSRSVG
jgi:hypothetical protein